ITLSAEDVAGPFHPLPAGMVAQTKLKVLGYASPLEALGERFHTSPALLHQLNPGKDFGRVGEPLRVPSVQATEPMPAVAKVVVNKTDATVSVLHAAEKGLAPYPASTGSKYDPLPLGEWTIKSAGKNPVFRYNPKLFRDAKASEVKVTMAASPNNPVGVVWIDLSKDHDGIHGTREPSKVGKTESHGCIGLPHGSALAVYQSVRSGMSASLRG
ncbi:MAG: L,D-transpeptidase, partial [Rhodanobacter sp.]